MAYSRKVPDSMPIPVEPGIMSAYVTADTTELLIPIPWQHVRLAYAEACFDVAEATNTGTIDIELDAASGTTLMSIAITASQASGSTVAATTSDASACKDIGNHSTASDYVNLEVAGSAADYTCNVYLYFEPEVGQ